MIRLPAWCEKDKGLAGLMIILLAFWLTYAGALCKVCCVDKGQTYTFLIDDMMIGMRYAYNFAHGFGLVWNPGERIQGYTDLGWTLFLSLIHWLGLPIGWNALVVQLTNGILHSTLVIYWFRILRSNYGNTIALVTAAIMTFNISLFVFDYEGYETTILCLLTSLAFSWCIVDAKNQIVLSKINYFAPLLAAGCAFIREDSMVIFASSVLVIFVTGLLFKASKKNWAITMASTLAGAALVGALLLWQKFYYGDFLPNTFYLKCNPSVTSILNGFKYILDFSFRDCQMAYLVGTVCFLVRGLINRESQAHYCPLLLTVTPFLIYIIAVGGDCFALGRFFTPFIPLMIVSCVLFLRDCYRNQVFADFTDGKINLKLLRGNSYKLELVGDIFVVFMIYSIFSFPFKLYRALVSTKLLNMDTVATVHAVRDLHLKPGSLVGVFRAGAVPYYLPELRFHDMLGKCDTHISHLKAHLDQITGHNKFDMAYSLGVLRPAAVISSHPLDTKFRSHLRSDESQYNFLQSFYMSADFQRYYVHHRVEVPIHNEYADIMWVFTRGPEATQEKNDEKDTTSK